LEGEENSRLASFLVYGVFLKCNISMPAHLILFEETNDLVVDINDHLPNDPRYCTTITYSKDVVVIFCEAFHSSIRLVIHPWMASYKEENPGRNK
jgi:hypothetical protein